MSLEDRANGLINTRRAGCSFGRLLRSLSDTERAAFDKLLAEQTPTEVSLILREEGYPNDRRTMIRHLKGECTCDTE